jgi:hypothetical protein
MVEPLPVNNSTGAGRLHQFASDMQDGDKLRAKYDKTTDTYILYTSNKGSGTGLKNFLFKSVDRKRANVERALVKILHSTPRKVMTTDMGKFKLTGAMVCSSVMQFSRHTGDITKKDIEQLTNRWQKDIARAHKNEQTELNPPPQTPTQYDANVNPFANPGDSPSGPPVVVDLTRKEDVAKQSEDTSPPMDELPQKYSPFKSPDASSPPSPPPLTVADLMLGRVNP